MKKLDIVNTVILIGIAGLFAYGIFFQNSDTARLKQKLMAKFYEVDTATARKIYRGLKMLGSTSIDNQIKDALASMDLQVRVSAVEHLPTIGGAANLALLKNSANDDNDEIALAAIRGLGYFRPNKIKTTLFDIIKAKNKKKQLAALQTISKNKINVFGEDLNKIETKDFDQAVKNKMEATLSVIGFKKKVTPKYYDDY